MLVLSRKMEESIDVDGGSEFGGVTITVVEIRGDKVRLGIEAKHYRSIHRREVQQAINRGQTLVEQAASTEKLIEGLKEQLASIHQEIAEGAKDAKKTSISRS